MKHKRHRQQEAARTAAAQPTAGPSYTGIKVMAGLFGLVLVAAILVYAFGHGS